MAHMMHMEDYDDVSHDSDSLPDSRQSGLGETKDFAGEIRTGKMTTREFKNTANSELIRERYSQKLPQDSDPVRCTPNQINFDGIDVQTLYVMTFSVRNCSNTSQRIRIKAPQSMYFALILLLFSIIN